MQISLHLSSVGPTEYLRSTFIFESTKQIGWSNLFFSNIVLVLYFAYLLNKAVPPSTSAVDLNPCSFFRNSITAGFPTLSIFDLSIVKRRSSPPAESFFCNQSIVSFLDRALLQYPLYRTSSMAMNPCPASIATFSSTKRAQPCA